MNWTRSETLALAAQACTFCYGLGLRPGRAGVSTPCNCVFRAIFRACHVRFRVCATAYPSMPVSSAYQGRKQAGARSSAACGPARPNRWGHPKSEYVADFCNVAKRELGEDTLRYKIFKFHFLLGADWKACSRKLGLDRGSFFHEVYRLEQQLGRAFRELQPYALYPLDEYFGGTVRPKFVTTAVVSRFFDPILGQVPSPQRRFRKQRCSADLPS